jgi:hypothetical protein
MNSSGIEPYIRAFVHLSIVTQLCFFAKEPSEEGRGVLLLIALSLIGEKLHLLALSLEHGAQKGTFLVEAAPLMIKDGARIMPIVGELVPARMTQHVRVNREGELGRLADPGKLLAKAGCGHRREALGGEDVRGGWHLLFVQATQGTDFEPTQDVGRGAAVLEPTHVEQALVEVDHIPAQRDELGGAQAVPVGDEDHGAVTVGVAAKTIATGLAQALDLFAGEELARPEFSIGAPARRKCPIRMLA